MPQKEIGNGDKFCFKYVRSNVKFSGAILELKGSIQYLKKRAFIEIISLIKHRNITTFVLKDTLSLKIVSGNIQWLIQKIFLGTSRYISVKITPVFIMTTNWLLNSVWGLRAL